MITRNIADLIIADMFKGKAIILYGARQCGKTTLMNLILDKFGADVLYLNGDEPDVRDTLRHITSAQLRILTAGKRILYIDEAQKIPDIGNTLKLMTDQVKTIQVIATGSSSFDLAGWTSESLTGRKYEYALHQLSFHEMVNHSNLLNEKRLIEHRLIFGYYPEIVMKPAECRRLLKLLVDSYLYKDIFSLSGVRNPVIIEKLTKAIALQVGSEVSHSELARLTGADKNTIEKYLNILEQAFIIFKLPALSQNERTEIRNGKKYYFYDNGIRNAVIGNYNPVTARTDIGALWENFIMSERKKYNSINNSDAKMYFWRTSQQQEIDLIEEKSGEYSAFEIKFSPTRTVKFSKTFTGNYPVNNCAVIHKENFPDFLI